MRKMENQVDSLMDDISLAKSALNDKELTILDLTATIENFVEQKVDLKKLKTRKTILQLEDALSHEVKHRR